MAAASRIEVSVKQDGKSLFSEIDRNKDRRLALREIRSAKEVLSQFDMNGDGSFAETELGTEYSLTFGLGQPEIRRVLAYVINEHDGDEFERRPAGREGLSGPEWFRRMDRNQDGDVSPREFLGRSDQFRQMMMRTRRPDLLQRGRSGEEVSRMIAREDLLRFTERFE